MQMAAVGEHGVYSLKDLILAFIKAICGRETSEGRAVNDLLRSLEE